MLIYASTRPPTPSLKRDVMNEWPLSDAWVTLMSVCAISDDGLSKSSTIDWSMRSRRSRWADDLSCMSNKHNTPALLNDDRQHYCMTPGNSTAWRQSTLLHDDRQHYCMTTGNTTAWRQATLLHDARQHYCMTTVNSWFMEITTQKMYQNSVEISAAILGPKYYKLVQKYSCIWKVNWFLKSRFRYLTQCLMSLQLITNKKLSYRRQTTLQGALVLVKSGRQNMGDNILWTL